MKSVYVEKYAIAYPDTSMFEDHIFKSLYHMRIANLDNASSRVIIYVADVFRNGSISEEVCALLNRVNCTFFNKAMFL